MANLSLELEKIFSKNIEFFKKYIPKLAQKFENYEPEADLVIDKNGINIFDRKVNDYLYPYDGRIVAAEQFANFVSKPSMFLVSSKVSEQEKWLHQKFLNKLQSLLLEYLPKQKLELGIKLPNLIVIGVGLGEHLKILNSTFEIENLVIVEPNEDFFYISLHFVDWEELLKPFLESSEIDKNFILLIGKDATLNNIVEYYSRLSLYRIASTFIFIHYLDKNLKELLKKLTTSLSHAISFQGFFDDEIISLKHTLQNVKKGIPVFKPKKDITIDDIPAVVVGAGPSLDRYIPYLKQYRNKLFLISCGTALGILKKHGIKPDLHVNIERNDPPYKAIISSTDEQYRRGIYFLGANNNYPPIFEAFEKDKSAMYLKGADAGAELFPKDIDRLYYVNPTVTNTGLALAFYLGFNKVYLVGVDLAFPEKKHHAAGSVYETVFKDWQDIFKGEIEVEANFGGTVFTNSIFYASKRDMEEGIKYFRTLRKEFEVYNPNFGAKIEGAETLQPAEFEEHLEKLDKENKNLAEFLFGETLIENPLTDMDLATKKMQIFTTFNQMKNLLLQELERFENYEDIPNALRDIYHIIKLTQNHNYIVYNLLRGTFTHALAHLFKAYFLEGNRERKIDFFKKAKEVIKEFLNEAEQELFKLYTV